MTSFKMKDLGEIHWFLGLEITCDQPQCLIFISQSCYITKVMSCFGFSNSCPVSTPMASDLKLGLHSQPEPTVNTHEYQSHISSVMYAMLSTHPDIGYAITKLSQYSSNPGEEHWTAINCLLHYLNSTKSLKLVYDGNSKDDDESGFSNSDWAGNPRDHHSISGFVFTMAGGAVSWSSKKQPSVALSSMEGKYMAMTHATKEAIWIQQFLHDIHFPLPNPTTLLVDNQGAIALTSNLTFHAWTKHIGVRHHFIHKWVEDNDISLKYIPTNNQVADILTKALLYNKHSMFSTIMGLCE